LTMSALCLVQVSEPSSVLTARGGVLSSRSESKSI
jgi:hypothetical protein